jgi:hypothetical protein
MPAADRNGVNVKETSVNVADLVVESALDERPYFGLSDRKRLTARLFAVYRRRCL